MRAFRAESAFSLPDQARSNVQLLHFAALRQILVEECGSNPEGG
jgi:hypothetical protein